MTMADIYRQPPPAPGPLPPPPPPRLPGPVIPPKTTTPPPIVPITLPPPPQGGWGGREAADWERDPQALIQAMLDLFARGAPLWARGEAERKLWDMRDLYRAYSAMHAYQGSTGTGEGQMRSLANFMWTALTNAGGTGATPWAGAWGGQAPWGGGWPAPGQPHTPGGMTENVVRELLARYAADPTSPILREFFTDLENRGAEQATSFMGYASGIPAWLAESLNRNAAQYAGAYRRPGAGANTFVEWLAQRLRV